MAQPQFGRESQILVAFTLHSLPPLWNIPLWNMHPLWSILSQGAWSSATVSRTPLWNILPLGHIIFGVLIEPEFHSIGVNPLYLGTVTGESALEMKQ